MADRIDVDQLIKEIFEHANDWKASDLNNGEIRSFLARIFGVAHSEIDCFVVVSVLCDGGIHSRIVATDLDPEDCDALLAEVVNNG